MAHEEAVDMANMVHQHMVRLVRACVTTLADRKITPMEGMQLSMQALAFGTTLATLLQVMTQEQRAEVLLVLEQGHWLL
jgi:hypothetical protein